MGNSFTSFREKGFWCRDPILEVWLRCLSLHLPGDVYDKESWLHDLRDQWMFASSGFCNGWVSPLLDEFITDSERVGIILDASDRTLNKLKAFGAKIPAAFANSLGIDMEFFDLSLRSFEELHDAFNSLLRGTLDGNESSGPFLPTQ